MDKIFANDDKITDTCSMTQIIGDNLKRARLERGFSLDEVSTLSSVSKSMLSDIERGRKCPTVAVLYKICEGIHVSLPSLLKAPTKIIEVVKNKEPVNYREGVDVQYLFRYDVNTSVEIHKIKLAPKIEITTDSHGSGVWEYIFVLDGIFTLIIEDEIYELEKGEAVRFLANKRHTYSNKTEKDAWIYDMVYYGA